jgi:hypothetical protein
MGGTAVEFMGVLTWGLSIQVSVVAKDSAPSLTSRASPERTGEAATLLGDLKILTVALLGHFRSTSQRKSPLKKRA